MTEKPDWMHSPERLDALISWMIDAGSHVVIQGPIAADWETPDKYFLVCSGSPVPAWVRSKHYVDAFNSYHERIRPTVPVPETEEEEQKRLQGPLNVRLPASVAKGLGVKFKRRPKDELNPDYHKPTKSGATEDRSVKRGALQSLAKLRQLGKQKED